MVYLIVQFKVKRVYENINLTGENVLAVIFSLAEKPGIERLWNALSGEALS